MRTRNSEEFQLSCEVYLASSVYPGSYAWVAVHTSGIYVDAAKAAADGLLQWKDLRKVWFGGMTTNERLVLSGLIRDRDDAIRTRGQRPAILSAIEFGSHAGRIIETALRYASKFHLAKRKSHRR
jgi:hypothetical protein